jgi:hypothetical protein
MYRNIDRGADNEHEQNKWDSGLSREGRSIGGARDKSGPTIIPKRALRVVVPIHDTPGISLKFIIGGGRDYSLIPCPPDRVRVRVPGEGAAHTSVRIILLKAIIK